MRKAKVLEMLTLKRPQVLSTAAGEAYLPLQGELRLLLLILHDLRDGFLLTQVWVRRSGFALVTVRILFFRGKVTIA